MYLDRAKIYIKAGDGGDGSASFYTEKFVANGGPDGGDGGKGGDIIFECSHDKNSLTDFMYSKHFRAENGSNGSGKFCNGKCGKDLVIYVPRGTVIRDQETGNIIADMFDVGQREIVLEGGRGGKGNCHFKSSRRQAPHFSQAGVKTDEHIVTLELKTIADVGLVGYPNVGKSTLLSVISSAKPKIANYHFTTLTPNLGVVRFYDNSFVVADIPGLIDGASEGVGLGHDFLRHVERTRLIVHVVDISGLEGRDPIEDYARINSELEHYDSRLASLPQIVALNKCDVADPDNIRRFRDSISAPIVEISGVTRYGIKELIAQIYKTLSDLPPVQPMQFEPFKYQAKDTTGLDIIRCDDGSFEICGGLIEEIARGVIIDDYDSFSYFQRTLKDRGVIAALKRAGVKDGDTVHVLDIDFDFVD